MRHPKIQKAHQEHLESLSLNERIGVYVTKHVGTMWMAYVFTVIGIGSLVGVVTNNTVLALLCGAVSSYFIQLVLLPVIMVGQDVEGRKNEHVLSEILQYCERILYAVGVENHGMIERNDETGAEVIMPNLVKEAFDAGQVTSINDILNG